MPKRSSRLDAAVRKDAILKAATPVFARLGREGATTKDLAKAAGVSEALLYKHFSGKEELYAALESHCIEANAIGVRHLHTMAPSTEALVKGVAILMQAVFPGIGEPQAHEDTKRLITASLLSDGRFAKAFLDCHVGPWINSFELSLKAAIASGDIEEDIGVGRAELWFVHHLANTLHLIALPEVEVVDYAMPRDALIESAVRFVLRGLGLSSAAIRKYYDPGDFTNSIFNNREETA